MSAQLAKGPLSSALGQWAFVGLGAYALAGGEALRDAAVRTAQITAQLSAGVPLSTILGEPDRRLVAQGTSASSQAPIVIHTTSSGGGGGIAQKPLALLVQLTIGAGLCWGSYIVLSNFLPEQIKEMLPVTRKFFDAAITSLGKGILQVKETLSEQILGLSRKQEELSDKQDETHTEVLSVRNDLGEVRFDLGQIADTVERCEASLSHAERRQSYTARGVRLLVRCVGAMMPGNSRLAGELDRFAVAGDEFQDEDEIAANRAAQIGNGTNTNTVKTIEGPQHHHPYATSASSGTPMTGRSNPQAQTPADRYVKRTPSYVTPNVARALNDTTASISSVETDPECAGHERSCELVAAATPAAAGGDALPPPTPQDLDEVRLLLDMVRRGGTITVK